MKKKELYEKAIKLDDCNFFSNEIYKKEFSSIYVITTNRKHDSGYKILDVIGQEKGTDDLYFISDSCDVIHFYDNLRTQTKDIIYPLRIDSLSNGVTHYFSFGKFAIKFGVGCSTLEIEIRR